MINRMLYDLEVTFPQWAAMAQVGLFLPYIVYRAIVSMVNL